MSDNNDILAEKLISKYLKGRSSIYFSRLMSLYHIKLYSYIKHKIGYNNSSSDDVYQETWLKISRSLDNYKNEGKFSNYLFFVATNSCYDYLRKLKKENENRFVVIEGRSKKNEIFLENMSDNEQTPEQIMIVGDKEKEIRDLISTLPEKQKEVILLRAQGFSFKDISKITNTSVNSLLSRMRYGILKIRKSLNLNFD